MFFCFREIMGPESQSVDSKAWGGGLAVCTFHSQQQSGAQIVAPILLRGINYLCFHSGLFVGLRESLKWEGQSPYYITAYFMQMVRGYKWDFTD